MKVFKHTIIVTVLSEESDLSNLTLNSIVESIDDGENIGTFRVDNTQTIEPQNLNAELEAIGNDGSFFEYGDE